MSDRKRVLEELREELIARLERYRAHKEQKEGPLDKDMEEQAVQLQNDDVIDGLEHEAEEELHQVMRALARLQAGQGDACESCGEAIPKARLEALPYTTLCRACAESR